MIHTRRVARAGEGVGRLARATSVGVKLVEMGWDQGVQVILTWHDSWTSAVAEDLV